MGILIEKSIFKESCLCQRLLGNLECFIKFIVLRPFQAETNKKVFSKRCKKQLVGCSSELALLTRSFSYFRQQISTVFESGTSSWLTKIL